MSEAEKIIHLPKIYPILDMFKLIIKYSILLLPGT